MFYHVSNIAGIEFWDLDKLCSIAEKQKYLCAW